MKDKQLKTFIAIFGFMTFLVNGDSYATSPMLIQIANEFGISISQAGLTFVAYMIPFGFFTVIFGPLSEKYGKVIIINIAAIGTALFSVAGGLVNNFYLLCLCRILNGIFAAAIMPVSMALIGETAGDDPDTLRSSIGKTMSLMFLGGAVAPAIGGLLSFIGSWRLVYIVYGVFEFVIGLLILFRIRVSSVKNHTRGIYKEALSNKELIQTVLLLSLIGMAVLGTFAYTGKFIEKSTGSSILVVGLILSCFGIGSMAAGRMSVKIRKRLQTKYFMFAGLVGMISFAGFIFFPKIYVIPFAMFGYGFSFMLIQPMMIAKAQASFPKHRGIVMSLASFNMCIGGGVGTFLNGIILSNLKNYSYIYMIGAVLFFIVAIIATKLALVDRNKMRTFAA